MMTRIFGSGTGILALFLLVFAATPVLAAAPNVVVTIRPIHALTARVMEGVGEPQLLLEGQASPHNYAMRPSDAVPLYNADLVIWTGEAMETFLIRIRENLKAETRTVAAAELPGVSLLSTRGTRGDTPAQYKGGQADWDPHIWLDPDNAAAITRGLADILAKMDPDNAGAYRANAEAAASDIMALKARIAERLAPVQSRPYIAAHDAFQYFEKAFGLTYGGAVVAHPSRPPSAGHIQKLNAVIDKQAVSCLLTEPAYRPPLISRLAEDADLRLVETDPSGLNLTPGSALYRQMMMTLADDVRTCLSPD